MKENQETDFNLDSMSLSEKLGNFDCVLVSKRDLCSESRINQICKSTSMRNIILLPSLNDKTSELYYGLLSPRETLKISRAEQYIKTEFNKHLFVYGGYSVEDVSRVSAFVSLLAERINSMKVEDRTGTRLLSPFEKCLLVHDIASNQHYEKDANPVASKSIYGGLLSGHMDCSGCAKFMCELLKLCAIPAVTESIIVKEESGFDFDNAFHCVCKVLIFDPIYQIKGAYICDPTFDMTENGEFSGIDYAMVNMTEYLKKICAEVDFSQNKLDLLQTYRNITKSHISNRLGGINLDKMLQMPTLISKQKFIKALKNIYRARENSESRIERIIRGKFENSCREFYEEKTFGDFLNER